MSKRLITVVAVFLLGLFTVGIVLAQSVKTVQEANRPADIKKPVPMGKVIQVTLVASPPNFGGRCPKRFEFKGTIKTDGPAVVKYTWLRSDGATDTIPHSVTFTAAGTQTVTDYWEIGQTYSGWEILKVTSPNTVESRKAGFTLRCAAPPTHKEVNPTGRKVE